MDDVPKPLKTARITLYIHGALGVVGSIVVFALLSALSGSSSDNQVPGFFIALVLLSFVMAVIMIACAATIVSQERRWPWTLAVVIESIAALSGLIGVFTGAFQSIAQVGLAAVVLINLSRPEVREWLGRSKPDIDRAWNSDDDGFPQA